MRVMSSFHGGFTGGFAVRKLPLFESFAGNVLWVSSTRSTGGPRGTRERPFGTIGAAIDAASAGNGDAIIIMPGHTETITGAAGIALSKSDVSVIGLGHGTSRPNFLMDGGTTVTAAITAANVYLDNLVFTAGHASVVAGITTTKKGTWLNNVEFQNNTTNENFLTPIKATSTTDADSDDLMVTNCRWHTVDADDLEFIEINATVNRLRCYNNQVVSAGTASPLILVATGKLLLGADIGWNRLVNAMTANELFISNDGTTNTGVIHNNYVGHADVTGTHDPGWDGGGFRLFNNLSTSVDNLSGLVLPAADVNL